MKTLYREVEGGGSGSPVTDVWTEVVDSTVAKYLQYTARFTLHRYELGVFEGCVLAAEALTVLKERVTALLQISTSAEYLLPQHDLSDAKARGKFVAC